MPPTHVPDRLLLPTAGGTPARMGTVSFTDSNKTAFVFCDVESFARFGFVQLTWKREWGSHPAERRVVSGVGGCASRGRSGRAACGVLPPHAPASVGPGRQVGALLRSSPGRRLKWSPRVPTRGSDRSAPENRSS